MPKIHRAIVSVTDKTGIVDLCRVLSQLNIEIISTGGTARVLRDSGIKVKDVSEYTGSPEILDGRLKTLHPKVEGGILGIRDHAQHQREMKDHGILPIDLVVVNLYAFEKTVGSGAVPLHEAIEQIDIGGPTMLRAAAKNYQDVTVVCDPSDYGRLMDELKRSSGSIRKETNFELAVKVFQRTAAYDAAISQYLTSQTGVSLPDRMTIPLEKIQDLRYGENPHQSAALYREIPVKEGSLVSARKLHGKELSFNNFMDLEVALACVREFKDPVCVIIKHTNPCGVALGKDLCDAFCRAKQSDPVSAFGGVIGVNRNIDVKTAEAISETFFECVMAPGYEVQALEKLKTKKNIRLMALDPFDLSGVEKDYKRLSGGLLVQDRDQKMVDLRSCEVRTKRRPTEAEYDELEFAWRVVKHVKSNAIVFTKKRQVLGVGAGQMSRVDSVKIASQKVASLNSSSLDPLVMASDAFFPFRDGLDEAATQKITAVVQPGGSVRDEEVIQAADENGIAMVFTGTRHFRH